MNRFIVDVKNIGKPLFRDDLIDIFQASEGSINMYYGLIGNGKTYNATADILDLLKQGKVIYANWHIVVPDFDDRENIWLSLRNWLFFTKRYYRIPCSENLHYFIQNNLNQLLNWSNGYQI